VGLTERVESLSTERVESLSTERVEPTLTERVEPPSPLACAHTREPLIGLEGVPDA